MPKRKLTQKQREALARGREKMAARRARALAATGATKPARRVSSPAPQVITVKKRRSGASGGGVSMVTRYLGNVRGDDMAASFGLGFAVNKRRATVESLINYAPAFLHGVGGYGIIALFAGILSHEGVGRKITSPIARAASIVAANKIGTRGGLYDEGQLNASLAGDDDATEGDEMDMEGLEALEGGGEDDGEAAEGDDGEGEDG